MARAHRWWFAWSQSVIEISEPRTRCTSLTGILAQAPEVSAAISPRRTIARMRVAENPVSALAVAGEQVGGSSGLATKIVKPAGCS